MKFVVIADEAAQTIAEMTVLFKGTHEECVQYMANHRRHETLDLVNENGKLSSFILPRRTGGNR